MRRPAFFTPVSGVALGLAATVWFQVSAGAAPGLEWPRFRGPAGQGVSKESGAPLHWSATSNVLWKTEIPGEGWSSPIVAGDRVFLTTATRNGAACHVLCLDRRSGKVLWKKEVFQQTPRRKERKNSYATPTPVTDGQAVYAVFGDGSMAALSNTGEVLWENRGYQFYSQHGLGASPILHEDLLIMPYDGSSDGEDKKVGWQKPWDRSFIAAVDKRTGKERWKARRGMSRIAHVTPNILKQDGAAQLISPAGDVIQGFNPSTGDRIWTAFSQGEGVVPSLAIGDGLIFTASGFEKSTIRTIRAGGTGDVTATHIAWEQTKGVPSQPSLLYLSPYLFTITDGGVAHCLEGSSGKIIWQERIGGNHSSSPVSAEGRIYFLSEEGESAVIEAKPEFKLLARNSLNERCQASPAIAHGNLFIRTEKNLFCIGTLDEP